MKRIGTLCLALLLLMAPLALSACRQDTPPAGQPGGDAAADPSETIYTVSFCQAGEAPVLRTVKSGEALTDVPEPKAKTGYTVRWDRTDFGCITSDLTVNAIEEANRYAVTYDLGSHKGDAVLVNPALLATYGELFTPTVPTCTGDTFLYWVITGTETVFEGGVWDRTEPLSLTAVWQSGNDQNSGWTGRY